MNSECGVFKGAVEEYLRTRPKEWLGILSALITYQEKELDESRSSYSILWNTEPSWMVISYCTEVQMMLGIQYEAPALPV
jgi:hypothetical protein